MMWWSSVILLGVSVSVYIEKNNAHDYKRWVKDQEEYGTLQHPGILGFTSNDKLVRALKTQNEEHALIRNPESHLIEFAAQLHPDLFHSLSSRPPSRITAVVYCMDLIAVMLNLALRRLMKVPFLLFFAASAPAHAQWIAGPLDPEWITSLAGQITPATTMGALENYHQLTLDVQALYDRLEQTRVMQVPNTQGSNYLEFELIYEYESNLWEGNPSSSVNSWNFHSFSLKDSDGNLASAVFETSATPMNVVIAYHWVDDNGNQFRRVIHPHTGSPTYNMYYAKEIQPALSTLVTVPAGMPVASRNGCSTAPSPAFEASNPGAGQAASTGEPTVELEISQVFRIQTAVALSPAIQSMIPAHWKRGFMPLTVIGMANAITISEIHYVSKLRYCLNVLPTDTGGDIDLAPDRDEEREDQNDLSADLHDFVDDNGNQTVPTGQVWSFGGGGVSSYATCNSDPSRFGTMSRFSSMFNPDHLRTYMHEQAHQFNAGHTYNSRVSEQRSPYSAFEPGAGTTLLSYAHYCPVTIGTDASGNDIDIDHAIEWPFLKNRLRGEHPRSHVYKDARFRYHINTVRSVRNFMSCHCEMDAITGHQQVEPITGDMGTNLREDVGNQFNYVPTGKPFMLSATAHPNHEYRWHQMDLAHFPTSDLDSRAMEFRATGPQFYAGRVRKDPNRFFPSRTALFKDSVENFQFVMPEEGLSIINIRSYQFGLQVQRRIPLNSGFSMPNYYALKQFRGPVVTATTLYGGTNFGWESGPWDSGPLAFTNSEDASGQPAWEGQVTWKVDGTNNSPFDDTEVDIYLVRNEDPEVLHPILLSTPNDGQATIQLPMTQWAVDRWEPFHLLIKPTEGIYLDVSPRFILHHMGCNSPYAINYDPNVSLPTVNLCDFGILSNIPNPNADDCKDPAAASYYAEADLHDPTRCFYNGCTDPGALNYTLGITNSFVPPAAPCILEEHACSGTWLIDAPGGILQFGFGFTGPLAPGNWSLNGISNGSLSSASLPYNMAFTHFNSRMHLYGHSASGELESMSASVTAPANGALSFNWAGIENGWFYYSDFEVLRNGQPVEIDKGTDYVPILCHADDFLTNGIATIDVAEGDEITIRIQTSTPDITADVGLVISNPLFSFNPEPGCLDENALNYNPNAVCHDFDLCVFNNYDPNAHCLDLSACNFDGLPTPGQDDGRYHNPDLCTYPGCQNAAATNYSNVAGCPGPCCFTGDCDEDITDFGSTITGDLTTVWVEVPDPDLGNAEMDQVYGGLGLPVPTGPEGSERILEYHHPGNTLNKEISFIYAWESGNLEPLFGPSLDVLIGETQVMSLGLDTLSGAEFGGGSFPLIGLATPPSLWPGDPFDVIADAPGGVGTVLSPDIVPATTDLFRGFQFSLPDTACTVRLRIPASPNPGGAYFAMQCMSLPKDCGGNDEIGIHVGCNNPAACNYLPTALADDGSCVLPGCSDPTAANYAPLASCPSACLYTDGDCGTPLTPDSTVAFGFSHAFAPGLAAGQTFADDSLFSISSLRFLAIGPDGANNGLSSQALDHGMSWVAQFDGEIQFVWTTASWDVGLTYDWPFYAVNGVSTVLNEDLGEPVDFGGWMVDAPGWDAFGPDILPATNNATYAGFEDNLFLAPQLLKTPISVQVGDTITLGVHSIDNLFGRVVTAFTGLIWTNHCAALPPTEVPGCKTEEACNFNPTANADDGSCTFPGDPCDDGDACTFDDTFDGECLCTGFIEDSDEDGVCDLLDACPSEPTLTEEGPCGCIPTIDGDGNGIPDCFETCETDLDGDGICADEDCDDNDPNFPHPFTGTCSTPAPCGCLDPLALNYSPGASCAGTCLYEDACGQWTVAAQPDHPPLGFGFNGPFAPGSSGFTERIKDGTPTGAHELFGTFDQALLLQGPAANQAEYWVAFRAPVNGTFAFTYAWVGDAGAYPTFELSGPGEDLLLGGESPLWMGPGTSLPPTWYGPATVLEGGAYLDQVGSAAYAASQWCGLPAADWIGEVMPEQGWRPSAEGWIPTQLLFESDALVFPNLAVAAPMMWPEPEIEEVSQAYHRPVVIRMEAGQTLSFHIHRTAPDAQGTLALVSPIWTNNCGAVADCAPSGTPGCTYSAACNFNSDATLDNGNCTFPTSGLLCDGSPDPNLTNSCPSDIDSDGQVDTQDLLLLLGNFGLQCQ